MTQSLKKKAKNKNKTISTKDKQKEMSYKIKTKKCQPSCIDVTGIEVDKGTEISRAGSIDNNVVITESNF